MNDPRAIVLNGTSSSGKSTLAKGLQRALERPFLHVEVDAFIRMLPLDSLAAKGTLGAALPPVVSGFYGAVSALLGRGNCVIVDQVLERPEWLALLLADREQWPVLFVGLHCPLPALREREARRGDRAPGLAERQYALVHRHGDYDLELDTSLLGQDAYVSRIVASGPWPVSAPRSDCAPRWRHGTRGRVAPGSLARTPDATRWARLRSAGRRRASVASGTRPCAS